MRKLYGVMGDPIRHSMSPDIHNDAFRRMDINADYHLFHVLPDQLENAVKGVRALNISGFNVTVPHKTKIMPFLDEIDELAGAIGAVNTVVNREGRLVGYNTDGPGFVRGIKERLGTPLANKKTLIIGAGGAARGIYFSLVKEGITQIDICNRTLQNAKSLIEQCPYETASQAFGFEEAAEMISQYDLIVQTTSAGMSPNVSEVPFEISDRLQASALVSDIIYNPLETGFLRQAKEKGAMTHNGIDMFVYQAALAFEIWTGVTPDSTKMRQIVVNKLGG
ncbi:shikimate dehydrogenase [Peribacillus deserti]|uniref:Shikimate dehydrogenase (NADP(+)) n=1 Tax=Peribacillus deserti TaxID=673318 RepID=A0A2N5M9D8_9BACI|nr:shikimate dehydrogenase [Peribacillus deserti]PLT30933.1 shikimate dehydrogenase [Peribacillus deserti]